MDTSSSKKETDWMIRIKSSRRDFSLSISPSATVASLQGEILSTLHRDGSSYVRLICQGRLLAPETALVSDFCNDEAVVHAVVTHHRVGALSRRGTGVSADGRAIRNHNSDDSDDDNNDSDDEEMGTERLGLDRLRSTGLTRNEISTLRVYFNGAIDEWSRTHPSLVVQRETDGVRRRLLLEDAWMATQGPTSEFRLNLAGWNQMSTMRRVSRQAGTVGTDRDFLWGFLLGFFVGCLMLLWVWMPSVPHKTKLGILTGISLQVGLGLLQAPTTEEGPDQFGIFAP